MQDMVDSDVINRALIEELKNISSPSKGMVMEPASSYGMTMTKLLDEKMLLHSLIETGVSTQFFYTVAENSPFSLTDWCQVTNIPYRTLKRYQKDNTMLKPIYTEKIFEFIEVVHMGVEVFGSSEKFERWLYKSKFIFGDKRPIDLLSSSYGKELVMTELHHIEHGIFA